MNGLLVMPESVSRSKVLMDFLSLTLEDVQTDTSDYAVLKNEPLWVRV